MREIQYTTKHDGNSGHESQTGIANEALGWDAELEGFNSKEDNLKSIRQANRKISLFKILTENLKVKFENNDNNIWLKARCPFKDHDDLIPSFRINIQENCFNCFGCNKSGKGVVKFLSLYTGKKQTDIAKQILEKYGELEDLHEEEKYTDRLDILILESSNYFNEFIQKNKSNKLAIEYAEKLLWNLDIYIESKSSNEFDLEFENLEARINILKRKLENYNNE